VTLTVTDNASATGSTTRQVSVTQGQAAVLSKIASIDNGDFNVCAVGVDGKAWCWGPNGYGQLGTGDVTQAYEPRPAAEGYLFRKVSVSTGGAFTCGITTTGRAYCWGNQEGGRLGDGTVAPSGQHSNSPLPVAGGLTFSDIAAGGDHACGIAESGAAYCWGHNERGQLGTGNAANSAVPAAVAGGLTFKSITTHQMVSCGIAADDTGYCWGNGSMGNLGSGSKSSSNVPVPLKGGLRFASLQLGVWTACGVTTDGAGYCWGVNGSGELGIGTKTPSETLEPAMVVGGYTWKIISPGVAVTCGVTTAGRGYCWGGNTSGERGDGPFPASDATSPVPVVGDLAFQSIDADWCSCGVASNVAYCWGPGKDGCVGDGAKVDRGVPTPVGGQ
jgi:alpha-tubulin suppressor-like RCC1 family protein